MQCPILPKWNGVPSGAFGHASSPTDSPLLQIMVPIDTVYGAPAEPEVEPAPPEVEEVEEEDESTGTDEPWTVILFNDEIHTFEEVIGQIMKATGCNRGKAEDLTWTVHNEGKATVYEGTFEECFEVQSVLKEIQLVTEIRG